MDLRDPFFESVGVEVIGGSAIDHDGIEALQVHLEYGDEAVPQPRDVVLQTTDALSQVRWTLDPMQGLAYRYRYRVMFGVNAPTGAAHRLESPWHTSNATKLMIDPRDLYHVENIRVQAVGLPFDRYAMVEVNLRHQDPEDGLEFTHTVVLSPSQDNHEWTFRRRPDGPAQFDYRLTFYPLGAEPIETEWQTSLDPAVLVSDLLPNELNVMVAPAGDFERIRRIMVEMRYDDPGNKVRQLDLLTFDKDEMKSWQVRLVDPHRREYQYRVIVQYRDGSIKSLPTVSTSDQLIFIGEVFERTAKVKVSPAGQSFDRAGLNKVRVRLSYQDESNQLHDSTDLVFTSLTDSFEWNYRIQDPAFQTYRYQITYFQDDGFIRRNPPQQSTHEHLVIPIPSMP